MDYSQQILKTFKTEWSQLSWEKQRHFAYRASLITDDLFWKEELEKLFLKTREKLDYLEDLSQQQRIDYSLNDKNRGFGRNNKSNDIGKMVLYRKRPEIVFWEDYWINYRYLARSKGRMKLMRDVDGIGLWMLKDDSFEQYPVWVIERIYDLYWFAGIDLRKKLEKLINILDGLNKFYALTHVVIGESDYYRQQVNTDNWAVNELVDNWNEVVELNNIDLLAEVMLCFKLAGINVDKFMPDLLTYAEENFSIVLGRLVSNVDSLNNSEHRNIVYVLFELVRR